MKIFISWATDEGKISATVAEALYDWLPKVIQAVKPWMSKQNLTPGKRWNAQIQKELDETTLGIFCTTKDGQLSQWVNFEAGALAKSVEDENYVIPLLINMSDRELKGPLQGFQATDISKEGIHKLIFTINEALSKSKKGENALDSDRLESAFDMNWPELERVLTDLPRTAEQETREQKSSKSLTEEKTPSLDESFDELLRLTRDTNAVINRIEQSPTQSLRATTPIGPGLVHEPERMHFSVEGVTSIIREYMAVIEQLSESEGFRLEIVRLPQHEAIVPTSALTKRYFLLYGNNLPPRSLLDQLARDSGLQITF